MVSRLVDNNLRESENGFWKPRRGKAAVCPEGYMNHPGDKYKCIPVLKDCSDRILSEYEYPPCGCSKVRTDCKMLDRVVTTAICSACGVKGRDFIKEKLG